jgi:hypothetical protein
LCIGLRNRNAAKVQRAVESQRKTEREREREREVKAVRVLIKHDVTKIFGLGDASSLKIIFVTIWSFVVSFMLWTLCK